MSEHRASTWGAVERHHVLYGRDGQPWRVEWATQSQPGVILAELRREGAHPVQVVKRHTDPCVMIVPTEDEAHDLIVRQLGGIVEGVSEDDGRLWRCPPLLAGFQMRDHLRYFHDVHAGSLAQIKDEHTPHLHTVMHSDGKALPVLHLHVPHPHFG